jgi:hypothetical protein
MRIMVRYNTENDGKSLFWRVIYGGNEYLADDVKFKVETFTTRDDIGGGVMKAHISAEYNDLDWTGHSLVVR